MNSTSTNQTNPFAEFGIFTPTPTAISQETQTSTPHTVTKTTQTTQTQLKKRHFTQMTSTSTLPAGASTYNIRNRSIASWEESLRN
jgi:hypothetical protein